MNLNVPTNLIINTSSLIDPMSNNPSGSSGKHSLANLANSKQLVELAAEQKHINYFLCLFHYQLIRILYLIIKYNIKSAKPYSFFDTKVKTEFCVFELDIFKFIFILKGKHTLFSELHTHPLISNDVDIKILNARKLVRQTNL